MNDFPRSTLIAIIAQYGPIIIDEPRRVEGLLKDLCGEHKREINALMGALRERVASDLRDAGSSLPPEVLVANLTRRLLDNLPMSEAMAHWAVESWAIALGIYLPPGPPLPQTAPQPAAPPVAVVHPPVPPPPAVLPVQPAAAPLPVTPQPDHLKRKRRALEESDGSKKRFRVQTAGFVFLALVVALGGLVLANVFKLGPFASALSVTPSQTPGTSVSSIIPTLTVAVSAPSATALLIISTTTATTAATAIIAPTTLPTLAPTVTATAAPTQSATFTSVPTALPVKTSDPTVCATIGQKLTSPVDGMIQVCVPAGKFLMGAAESDKLASPEERPQHVVTLDAFWIDQTEVTNAMYQQCVRAGKCPLPFETKSRTRVGYYGSAQFANYPVIYVTWVNANSYCQWVGRRLPSEAEWKKAARGTEGWSFPWGNAEPSEKVLNYNQFVTDTTEVGKYPNASPYGALDMAGNVFEWVADWSGEAYYVSSPAINPTGPTGGTLKVLRGGSWFNNASDVRSTFRAGDYPGGRADQNGFRCAR